jgi:beta-lactamase class A
MLNNVKKLSLEEESLSPDPRTRPEECLVGNTTGAALLRSGVPSAWRIGNRTGKGRNGAANDIAICWPPRRFAKADTAYFVESQAS